jgi:hypothetical protein
MKKVQIFLIIIFTIISSISSVKAQINTNNKYKIKYDSDLYFWKDEIIENDFSPNIGKYTQIEILQHLTKNKKNINIINLNIKKEDLVKLFTNYYWKLEYYKKPKIEVEGYIIEGENIKIKESFKWIIKPKWNFSLQSLKIWLSLNIEWKLKNGFFKNKDKLALRHLMYDVTWINEKSYLNSYFKIYKKIFGFNPYHIKWKYYWVFINWKLYWYYLVLDDTKEDFLKNNWNKKNKETCIIKSKIRHPKYRWDLTLSFWKNRENIIGRDDMLNIYKIEEWDKKQCLVDFRELLLKIDKKDFKWVKNNFYNINEIYLWQKFLLETNYSWWLYQNFLLIKHNWKWNFTLWDWDFTLQEMNFPFKKEKLKNNWLINLILENKKDIDKYYIKKIDDFNYKEIIKEELKNNYSKHFSNIILDRIIWYKHVKKNIWNRNKEIYKYANNTKDIIFLKKTIKTIFINIYLWKKYLN